MSEDEEEKDSADGEDSDIEEPQRKRRQVEDITIKKFEIVVDCNSGECRIDVSDQMTSCAAALQREVKWYRKLVIELSGRYVSSAHILFKEATEKQVFIIKFACKSFIGLDNANRNLIKQPVHTLKKRIKDCKSQTLSCKSYDECIKTAKRIIKKQFTIALAVVFCRRCALNTMKNCMHVEYFIHRCI